LTVESGTLHRACFLPCPLFSSSSPEINWTLSISRPWIVDELSLAYRLRSNLARKGTGALYANSEKRQGRNRLDFIVGNRYSDSDFVVAVSGSWLHVDAEPGSRQVAGWLTA
jgi:hypothetical protein